MLLSTAVIGRSSACLQVIKEWGACSAVLLVVLGSVGCSSDASDPPDCEVRTEEQALPPCIGVSPFAEEFSDECEFSADISNQCTSQLELAFYCDPDSTPDGRVTCPEDRELAANTTDTVALGPLYGGSRWRREVAIEFIGVPDEERGVGENDEAVQPAVSLTLVYERVEADDVHGLCATTTVSGSRGSQSRGIIVLMGLPLLGLVWRRSERALPNSDN